MCEEIKTRAKKYEVYRDVQRREEVQRCVEGYSRVFHKLDEIGNNDNIGIRGFTTCKKSSDKMLPQWE